MRIELATGRPPVTRHRCGFVVVNVDLLEQLDRDEDATCALEAMWAAFGESPRCEVILIGHSSGAGDLLGLADRCGQEPEASILRPAWS